MIATIFFFLLFPFLVLSAVWDWVRENPKQKALRWKAKGMTQLQIAEAMGITRYKLRKILAT